MEGTLKFNGGFKEWEDAGGIESFALTIQIAAYELLKSGNITLAQKLYREAIKVEALYDEAVASALCELLDIDRNAA